MGPQQRRRAQHIVDAVTGEQRAVGHDHEPCLGERHPPLGLEGVLIGHVRDPYDLLGRGAAPYHHVPFVRALHDDDVGQGRAGPLGPAGRPHDEGALAEPQATGQRLGQQVEDIEHRPRAAETRQQRRKDGVVWRPVELQQAVATPGPQRRYQPADQQTEGQVLHEVSRHARPTVGQGQPVDGSPPVPLHRRLAGGAQAQDVHLVAGIDQGASVLAHVLFLREVAQTDEQDTHHAPALAGLPRRTPRRARATA
ncbi:hypothetical protein HRbin24_02033 [bacterium HR24]|nr:hypothetical protein HRbin24_02033 [bacterium HR24]